MQKQSVWILWAASFAAMIFGSGWIGTIGSWVVGLLVVVHFIEFVVNIKVFQQAGGSMVNHFVQTMIFGLFHWTPIKESLEEG